MKIAINTSTLLPFNLSCADQITVSANAGFQGIELWTRSIQSHLEGGGTLAQLKQLLADNNIDAFNGISFIGWADQSADERERAFEAAKVELDWLAQLGVPHIAAPVMGNLDGITLDDIACRFAKFYALCGQYGIVPMLEIWGHSTILSSVSRAAYALMESNVEKPLMLCDVYHAYRGGDTLEKLKLIGGGMLGLVHINDYPTSIPHQQITDADRVLPGEGDAPYPAIMQALRAVGYQGYLSLETFPKSYGDMTCDQAAAHAFACCKSIL